MTEDNYDAYIKLCDHMYNGKYYNFILDLLSDTKLVQHCEYFGTTLLHESPLDPKMVRALILLGADPNARTSKERTPLMIMAMNQANASAETLLRSLGVRRHCGDVVNAKDSNQATPLMYATYAGGLSIVKALVAMNASVYVQDNNERTPLMYACGPRLDDYLNPRQDSGPTDGCFKVVDAHFVDWGKWWEQRRAIILHILSFQDPEHYWLLTDQQDKIGETALIRAASVGATPLVRALLDAQADVELKSFRGNVCECAIDSYIRVSIWLEHGYRFMFRALPASRIQALRPLLDHLMATLKLLHLTPRTQNLLTRALESARRKRFPFGFDKIDQAEYVRKIEREIHTYGVL